MRTHYDNLGVARNAQPEVIRAAYKALVQKYHPDRNPDNPDAERIMKIINTAFEVLSDPIERAEHDRWIDEQERRKSQEFNDYQKQANQSYKSKENYSSTKNNKSRDSNRKSDDIRQTVLLYGLGLGFPIICIVMAFMDGGIGFAKKEVVNYQESISNDKYEVEREKSYVDTVLAKKEYDKAISDLNKVWKKLHPSTRESLRPEQRAINKKREAECTSYGMTKSQVAEEQIAYRYECEVPHIRIRTEYLETQLDKVIYLPQLLPETGTTNRPNLQGDNPLQIRTSTGSHYWVKIVNAYNESEQLVSYFIRGGEILDVSLPTGSYIIKYAYGDTWYGEEGLFGEQTEYSKADEIFEFYGGQGYTIELIKQAYGNLHTTDIGKNQF